MSATTSLEGLLNHLDASVSPAHGVRHAAARLASAGFVETSFGSLHRGLPARGYIADQGLLLGWSQPDSTSNPFRSIGAHTDSPGLRIKPRPDVAKHG
ncbi:MAG: M18 family aminopeptidase, partial [Actinomycetota bacterium]